MFAQAGRRVAMGLAVVVLLAAAGVIVYRVLAPAETLNQASGPYPARTVISDRALGTLTAAPLIVNDGLRVYAEKRRVWADAPVDARHHTSPYWSLRRWPAEVVGVVAVEADTSGDPPIVVTRWSDGAVVTLDARTGRIAWRLHTAHRAGSYTGQRTGASTVYQPNGLFTARSVVAGRPVVVILEDAGAGGHEPLVGAYEPWTGTTLWKAALPRCAATTAGAGPLWTGAITLVVPHACTKTTPASVADLDVLDAGTGRLLGSWQPPETGTAVEITPWGCALGRSDCRLFRAQAGGRSTQWRLAGDGTVTVEPHVEPGAGPGSTFALDEGYVDYRRDGYVRRIEGATGAERWKVPLRGYVLGADGAGVYMITPDRKLVVLDPATGQLRLQLDVRGEDPRGWTAGHVYIHDRFLAIERLTGRPTDPDTRRFYGLTPVLLMAV